MPCTRSVRIAPGQLELGLLEDPLAIRALLASNIRAREPGLQLVPEMGVCLGSGRIDLAAIGTDLDGYEIKSDRDCLDRLPTQARLYGAVFARLTLVAAPRHIEQAQALLPDWWGLSVVDGAREQLVSIRPSSLNPDRDALSLARLLWRDEVVAALRARTGRSSRAPRLVLWQELAERVPPAELRDLVCTSLRQRTDWRAAC